MKSLKFITGLGALFFAVNLHAGTQIDIGNTDLKTLQIKDVSAEVRVAYPGNTMSGVCGLEIRADSYNREIPISKLLNKIEIKSLFDLEDITVEVVNDVTVRVSLQEFSFVDGIQIRTRSGETLEKVIAETLGQERTVVVLGQGC